MSQPRAHKIALVLGLLLAAMGRVSAQTPNLEQVVPISRGLHPWYEVKVDPEDPNDFIVCGTQWDPSVNGPAGFVDASFDGGKTWHSVFQDRETAWVTEQSCAFGPRHRAYFISEASNVIDGFPHHELGTTRLFVSTDGGRHWAETASTRWADYSTSAVSTASGQLYTFFQAAWIARQGDGNRGNSIGLLVFSRDGKKISGPFFDAGMEKQHYRGVYPSDAVALQSGAVVALFYGKRQTQLGWELDVGTIHADAAGSHVTETVIDHPAAGAVGGCSNMSNGSMAYDPADGRLFVAYRAGCANESRMMLTSSVDEGRTWAPSTVIAEGAAATRISAPSLVIDSHGELGLLWRNNADSDQWLFSYVLNHRLNAAALDVSPGTRQRAISDDSLWTWIYQPGMQVVEGGARLNDLITVNVRDMADPVWRAEALVALPDKILAVWPARDDNGMRLYSGVIGGSQLQPAQINRTRPGVAEDVTSRTLLLYCGPEMCDGCGGQHFDPRTGELTVYVVLANRGTEPIKKPIKLEVRGLRSARGSISIINASNGLSGVGAVWDVDDSLTGSQISPGTSSNPFRLSFKIGHITRRNPSGGSGLFNLTVAVSGTVKSKSGRED